MLRELRYVLLSNCFKFLFVKVLKNFGLVINNVLKFVHVDSKLSARVKGGIKYNCFL